MLRSKRLALSLLGLGAWGALATFSASAGILDFDDGCRASADRTATLDAAGLKKVVIRAAAGDLKIAGEPGLAKVSVTGRACASKAEILPQIQLRTRREGDIIFIDAVLPDHNVVALWRNEQAALDLAISLPASALVTVDDGSGDMELHRVQSAVVNDSSGNMEVGDIANDLRVSDSSGDIKIDRVGANVTVTDSSGEIKIADVKGNVDIPTDSSGDMEIVRIGGSAHVQRDSSGDISMREITGDVLVESDSSGDISVKQVGGNFAVESDGSGRIYHDQVAGSVRLPHSG